MVETNDNDNDDGTLAWANEAEKELKKIPFFVRGKARRNTEAFATQQGLNLITVETLYDAKPTSPDRAKRTAQGAVPIQITLITLDNHMSSAVDRARVALRKELPGLELNLHAVAEWGEDETASEACRRDIESADIVVANMIFLEEHALKLAPWLEARRDHCDCIVGAMSAAEVVKKTKLGDFNMAKPTGGIIELLKKLKGKSKKGASAGQRQMKMLRTLPKVLKYIPGKAQDVRAYFMTLQYLLAGSDENLANLIRFLVNRYAAGEREVLRGCVKVASRGTILMLVSIIPL